jgi:glycosyltransferase involved in cell wall biosynthesis
MNVAVILTCHNEGAFIEQAIRSVVSQTAANRIDEIVVVDDASTDGSAALLARLACEIPRLRVEHSNGGGVSAARNVGIRETRAPLVAFLDGDDYWVEDKLELQLAILEADDRIGLVYSDFVDFSEPDASDAQLVTVRRFHAGTANTLAEYFVHDAPIMPSSVVIRRRVFDDVGVFDASMRLGEDTEFCLRVAERWHFQHVPGGLFFKRRHSNNLTRRLDVLVPINEVLTQVFAERNPSLRGLVHKRLSRRYARAGHDCARHGDTGSALRHLGRSLAHAPLFWRPYMYLALLLVPWGIRDQVLRFGRRLYHGPMHHGRGDGGRPVTLRS